MNVPGGRGGSRRGGVPVGYHLVVGREEAGSSPAVEVVEGRWGVGFRGPRTVVTTTRDGIITRWAECGRAQTSPREVMGGKSSAMTSWGRAKTDFPLLRAAVAECEGDWAVRTPARMRAAEKDVLLRAAVAGRGGEEVQSILERARELAKLGRRALGEGRK